MPWSDWQTGRVKLQSWSRSATLESRDGYDVLAWPFEEAGTFVWDPVEPGFGSNPEYVYCRRNVEITTPGLETPATDIRYAQQSTRPTAWLHDLDWFPPALDLLVEGVDYSIRPDRTDDDDDAYVEYESDTCSFVENLPPLVRSYTIGTTGSGAGAGWELRAQMNGHYVPTPREEAYILPFSVPVSTVFASGTDGSTPPVNYTADFPTIAETVLDVTISAWVMDLGGFDSLECRFEHGVPTLRYQMPRWRYWIPGILPLRQYPRNDGLRGGAPSARPTSRQGSIARRTYL